MRAEWNGTHFTVFSLQSQIELRARVCMCEYAFIKLSISERFPHKMMLKDVYEKFWEQMSFACKGGMYEALLLHPKVVFFRDCFHNQI